MLGDLGPQGSLLGFDLGATDLDTGEHAGLVVSGGNALPACVHLSQGRSVLGAHRESPPTVSDRNHSRSESSTILVICSWCWSMCLVTASSTIWRSIRGGIASTSTLSPRKPAARLSVFFVGLVGKFSCSICPGVTAMRSTVTSALGANPRTFSSKSRHTSTPLGS